MTKAFDKTLETVSELEDAMALVKTEMTISDSHKSEDLQKISALLDQASNLLIEAIVLFQKYEKLR